MSAAGGRNCLVPIDGLNESDAFAAEESYNSVDWIMNYLASKRSSEHIPIIYLLDCCRSEIATENRGRVNLSNFQGETANSYIMYATSGPNPPRGADGANETFTELLLKHIDMDVDITKIAMKIRTILNKKFKGKQVRALFLQVM